MYNTGQIIKLLRYNKGYTQEELGELIGVKKNSIQKYEDGTVKNLKIETIRKICNCFEIPAWLIIFPEYLENRTIEDVLYDFKDISIMNQNKNLLLLYLGLNKSGREKVFDYLGDLNKIPEYLKHKNTPTS